MAFKRYDGFVMHVPQEFIDSNLPVCPFCHTNDPHWLLDSKMEFTLAGGRTYYQCEKCRATMSSLPWDAAAAKGKNFAYNPAAAGLNAAAKGMKHQEVGVTYLRVDDVGSVSQRTDLLMQELPITFFQEMAAPQPAEQVHKTSPFDEVRRYKELLDLGVITQDEFDAMKKKLLGL